MKTALSLAMTQIKHQDSAFCLSPNIRKTMGEQFQPLLAQSLSELGFLQPLLVYQDKQGTYHLLDGFFRLAWAKQQNLITVPCHILPPETPLTLLFQYLLTEHYAKIQASLIGRIAFITLALAQGIARSEVCQELLPHLGFEGHEKVLRQCEAISRLPTEVLDFCQEKNFSMRQCLALTRQPEALLQQVMAWRESLGLTATIIEELLMYIKDLLRSRPQDITTFMAAPEICDILNSKWPKPEKTRLLRQLIKTWRYPILSQTQENLQTTYQQIPLPTQTHLNWDESLERHEIILQLKTNSVEQWQQQVASLQEPVVIEGIEKLLAQL